MEHQSSKADDILMIVPGDTTQVRSRTTSQVPEPRGRGLPEADDRQGQQWVTGDRPNDGGSSSSGPEAEAAAKPPGKSVTEMPSIKKEFRASQAPSRWSLITFGPIQNTSRK